MLLYLYSSAVTCNLLILIAHSSPGYWFLITWNVETYKPNIQSIPDPSEFTVVNFSIPCYHSIGIPILLNQWWCGFDASDPYKDYLIVWVNAHASLHPVPWTSPRRNPRFGNYLYNIHSLQSLLISILNRTFTVTALKANTITEPFWLKLYIFSHFLRRTRYRLGLSRPRLFTSKFKRTKAIVSIKLRRSRGWSFVYPIEMRLTKSLDLILYYKYFET